MAFGLPHMNQRGGLPPFMMDPPPVQPNRGARRALKRYDESSEGESDESESAFSYDFVSGKGALSTVRNIYRSKKDESGEWTWVDKCPEDIEEAAENSETEKCAIIIRNKKSQDSRRKLEADSIIVQSPWLKQALSDILKDYPGVTCELHRLTFDAPFAPFIHRWTEFTDYMKNADLDPTTIEHLQLLHGVFIDEIGEKIKEYEDYVLNSVITYESLWMIFQPGSVVISEFRGALSAFELIDAEYGEDNCGQNFGINLNCVDWNGTGFCRANERVTLRPFQGTRAITSLNAFPIQFSEDKEEIENLLIERGKKFEELAGHHFKAYNGTAIDWDRENQEMPIEVSGRIIIDAESFNRFSVFRHRPFVNFTAKDKKLLSEYQNLNNDKEESSWALKSREGTVQLKANERERAKLSPYHQMLCRSRVRGYSLKHKKWLEFFLSLVSEIEWNKDAFDSLVLPENKKELVLAFSESQLENRSAFDDVISGKGRGVIMLLSGPPGVGKTLTAEAVAEHMRCPLHSITSGDLGARAADIEQSLSGTLNLMSKWNAILLIDECDVFLEARARHDLDRNKMVSIFLRTLEYYEGIMFLTTNRVDNIDAAFQSRIHVSLQYPALTNESRRRIWSNFLKHSRHPHELADSDLDELALVQLNGRQIKNVLKTSQLLGLRKKQNLNRELIETVLSIEKDRPTMGE